MIKKLSVGSELDSYCGRCKLTLNHAVVAMVVSEPRRVRCLTCGSEHNHRLLKSTPTRPKKTRGSRRTGLTTKKPSGRWNNLMAEWDETNSKTYSIYQSFCVNDCLTHSKFGKGFVIDVPGPDRMITLFESGEKMLMQGKQRV